MTKKTPPGGGIADPGAMKSWEAALLTHKKVVDFPHPNSVSLKTLPSFPPPPRPFPPFGSSPQPSPFPQAAWMTLRALHVSARQEKLSSRCTTPHLVRGGKLLCEINTRPSLNPCTHTRLHAHTHTQTGVPL